MKCLQYNLYERDTKNASGKAKNDVSAILRKYGVENLYNPSSNAYMRLVQQFFSVLTIPSNATLFVQYPANLNFFYRLIRHKKCYKIAIIHDLESLRGIIDVQSEIFLLNSFDVVISHNFKMTKFLKNNGLNAKIIELNIFDYLISDDIQVNKDYDKRVIVFAGNLQKSEYLSKLGIVGNLKFNLYGIPETVGLSLNKIENISYNGAFSADKLIGEIQGGWGLVWDGNSLETCNGINGEYMRYNCPHKVSMYIIAERPIIIWEESAMANFVKDNKLGVVIRSLTDLPSIIHISEAEYNEYVYSVRKLKRKLGEGRKLGEIIEQLIADKI